MLVLCLGVPRSGSTWAFNVVRALLADAFEDFTSLYAETGAQFAERCPPGARNVLIKAHAVDDVLVRTLDASGATSILTWRDPRDVVASMAAVGLGDVLALARSASGAASAVLDYRNGHPDALSLRYEDGFTADVATIRSLADHLGLRPDAARVQAIYDALDLETLRGELDRWSSGLDGEADFRTHVDPATHWHKDHLGDARVGKWREIAPPEARSAVDSALGPLDRAFREPQPALRLAWSRGLFTPAQGARPKWGAPADSADGLVLLGPHASLPSGRWRLSFDVILKDLADVELKVDLTLGLVSASLRHLATEPQSSFWLEFDHRAPLAPLTVKVSRESPPTRGWIGVADLRAERLGAAGMASAALAARRVTGTVTPS
jgi:hypothetical protein